MPLTVTLNAWPKYPPLRGSNLAMDPPQSPRRRPPQCWALWRLDDNGNRFLMETFDSRARAEAAARDYTARGHKQTYWVEAATDRNGC